MTPPIRKWRLLGFEPFDLLVVAIQLLVLLTAFDIEMILSKPLFRLIIGIGFVTSLVYLSCTRIYSHGVKVMNQRYSWLATVMFCCGSIFGGMVFAICLIGPVRELLDFADDGLGTEVFVHPLSLVLILPGVLVSVAFLPFLFWRALRRPESKPGLELPNWLRLMIRIAIWATANFFLFYLYKAFAPSAENDLMMSLFLSCFMLAFFYLPVRVQDAFFAPEEPHLQSFLQTAVLLTLFHSGIRLYS